MSFDKLLADMGELKKSMDAGQGAIEGAPAAGEGEGAPAAAGAEGALEGLPMGKSFSLTLEDGTEIEATDGTELVKALLQRHEASEGKLEKALGDVAAVLTAQGDLIKSLTAKVAAFGADGRGRRSTVAMPAATEQPLAKSQPQGMTAPQFLAKCEAAWDAKKITGDEMTYAETLINRGQPIPEALANKVLG